VLSGGPDLAPGLPTVANSSELGIDGSEPRRVRDAIAQEALRSELSARGFVAGTGRSIFFFFFVRGDAAPASAGCRWEADRHPSDVDGRGSTPFVTILRQQLATALGTRPAQRQLLPPPGGWTAWARDCVRVREAQGTGGPSRRSRMRSGIRAGGSVARGDASVPGQQARVRELVSVATGTPRLRTSCVAGSQ